jgi:3-hydroxyisobutyrate dehydrogenase
MGTNSTLGKAGCGQYAKLVNQITLAGTMSGMCEGLAFAKSCGWTKERCLRSYFGRSRGSWS